MRINDVAKLTGLPISTLRFYERKNIIPDTFVKRDPNNYRIYSEEVVDYLNDVKTLLSVEFSIEELRLLVDQQHHFSSEAKKKVVEQKLIEIENLQRQLQKSKAFLKAILEGEAKFQTKC
ncbi:MerR family transcriptional regulator [Cohnella sp. GCM10020058]|uniref:MerR family transcriptional regulator n=1 Tax=Cohnella sp. GCM10020058 TaxID=3317330 RepID=UPI0036418297